jgi:PncC family amidohydrolase
VIEGSSLSPLMAPLSQALRARKLRIAVAESCTGGLVAAALTDLPGSSDYFAGGVVPYADNAKLKLLDVPEEVLREHGAVSSPVAKLMAEAACRLFSADVGLGVTGIAGPTSVGDKPVGLTFIAASFGGTTMVRQHNWTSGRAANRIASVEAALSLATEVLS